MSQLIFHVTSCNNSFFLFWPGDDSFIKYQEVKNNELRIKKFQLDLLLATYRRLWCIKRAKESNNLFCSLVANWLTTQQHVGRANRIRELRRQERKLVATFTRHGRRGDGFTTRRDPDKSSYKTPSLYSRFYVPS